MSILKRLICWWFGCVPDFGSQYYDHDHGWSNPTCKRCDALDVDYTDLVGDTRHNRLKSFLRWHLYRRWHPPLCDTCGQRRHGCDDCPPF
jgi:hypothetical protein